MLRVFFPAQRQQERREPRAFIMSLKISQHKIHVVPAAQKKSLVKLAGMVKQDVKVRRLEGQAAAARRAEMQSPPGSAASKKAVAKFNYLSAQLEG